jgi:hypothetical protein
MICSKLVFGRFTSKETSNFTDWRKLRMIGKHMPIPCSNLGKWLSDEKRVLCIDDYRYFIKQIPEASNLHVTCILYRLFETNVTSAWKGNIL